MKKEVIKTILIIVLCLIIGFIVIYKKQNKFVYIENKEKQVCQKCVIINNEYYCQTFGIKESESGK